MIAGYMRIPAVVLGKIVADADVLESLRHHAGMLNPSFAWSPVGSAVYDISFSYSVTDDGEDREITCYGDYGDFLIWDDKKSKFSVIDTQTLVRYFVGTAVV